MPSLPLPMISALVLGFLFVALVLERSRHWLLCALAGACALQALIISLGQHYGVDVFRAVQPVTATFMPPLAWGSVSGDGGSLLAPLDATPFI